MSIKLYHHWDFSDSTREMGIKTKENNNNKRNKKKNKNIHLKMVIGNKIRRNEEWFKT